jgi:D-glycero-D-manno-heptose 1,7-bisphosphate phosphatase
LSDKASGFFAFPFSQTSKKANPTEHGSMSKKIAIFLDRDGVINPVIFHQSVGLLETPFTVRQFRLLPQIPQTIRTINRMGWKAIVVSNQPGVAMRRFSMRTLHEITRKMERGLLREGARLDGVYYCLHHPVKGVGSLKRNCQCRKPKPGLLLKAAREHGIDLSRSYFIGDSITDVQAGRRAGCRIVLLAHMKCDLCSLMAKRGVKPDYLAKDLRSAIRWILRKERRVDRTK